MNDAEFLALIREQEQGRTIFLVCPKCIASYDAGLGHRADDCARAEGELRAAAARLAWERKHAEVLGNVRTLLRGVNALPKEVARAFNAGFRAQRKADLDALAEERWLRVRLDTYADAVDRTLLRYVRAIHDQLAAT